MVRKLLNEPLTLGYLSRQRNRVKQFSFCILALIFISLFLSFASGCSAGRGVKIVSAVYGSNTNYVDVSDQVTKMIDLKINFKATPEFMQVDPLPYHNKALVIVFEVGGRRHIFTSLASDNSPINAGVLLESARNGGLN